MRNLFDQYEQQENRLTHALACCLRNDPRFLRSFVRWATDGSILPGRHPEIGEQGLPGNEESRKEKTEHSGIPDAWIWEEDKWCLLIECKIKAHLTRHQLQRHYAAAQARQLPKVRLLALEAKPHNFSELPGVRVRKWSELYRWLAKEKQSVWVKWFREYMEIVDGQLEEGALTEFTGIPFGKETPYNYVEAKRLLRYAMEELRKRKDLQAELRVDPEAKGRKAIKGKERHSVWDCLQFKRNSGVPDASSFTKHPHLTLEIDHEKLFAEVEFPDSMLAVYRRRLLRGGEEAFQELLIETSQNIQKRLRKINGACPWLIFHQRRWLNRAEFDTNLRVELDFQTDDGWLDAIYLALAHKRGKNFHLSVGAIFPYNRCNAVSSPEILDHIASAWIACKPLVQRMTGQ